MKEVHLGNNVEYPVKGSWGEAVLYVPKEDIKSGIFILPGELCVRASKDDTLLQGIDKILTDTDILNGELQSISDEDMMRELGRT